MRLSARVQRLERRVVAAAGSSDAQARQAWLREQRLPEQGDRLAAVAVILQQADVPPDAQRDPARREAVSAFFSQLSEGELRALVANARQCVISGEPGTSVRSPRL
jgi:hypothetical protein